MRLFTISTYDSSDDLQRDGTWTERAKDVLPELLPTVIAYWRDHGYSEVSIDVRDQDGEMLEGDQWPA